MVSPTMRYESIPDAVVNFELVGLDRLNRALMQAPDMVQEEIKRYLKWAVTHMKAEVQDRTPTGEGHLRRSIIGQTEVSVSGMLGVVGSPLEYATPVELGTRPHPVSEEGIMAITKWVMHKIPLGQAVSLKTGRPLKNADVNARAKRIANAIAWKIQREGSEGHFMFERALNANWYTLSQRWEETVERIVYRLGSVA